MSTVLYVALKIPEKHLIKEHIYHYHPNKDTVDKIIEDVLGHSKVNITEDFTVNVQIEVSIKEYEKQKNPEKNLWYENQQK